MIHLYGIHGERSIGFQEPDLWPQNRSVEAPAFSLSDKYPSHYGASRTSRYKQDITNKQVVADCIGGCKGYAWSNGGQGVLEAIGTDKTTCGMSDK